MTIERVTENDAEELLQIYAPYIEETAITFEYEVPSIADFRHRISSISSKYPYLKAVENGQILGYAYAGCFKDRSAYDWSVESTVYVRRDCRKSGIGKALYTSLESALQSMGILNMNACIACPIEKNKYLTDDSIRFHEALGFSEVGRFHKSGCKFGEWFDMIWMEKLIGTHENDPAAVAFGRYRLK